MSSRPAGPLGDCEISKILQMSQILSEVNVWHSAADSVAVARRQDTPEMEEKKK